MCKQNGNKILGGDKFFATSTVKLASDIGDSAKWQHVASEGEYLGYHGGDEPFAFTKETFS